MAVCFLLKEVVVFLCIVEALKADRDLLETIQLDAENPPEVNDFLHNVIKNKQVFSWIRHAARSADQDQAPEMTPYRQDMQQSRFVKQGPFMKRNVRSRRPINDVYPYVYENEDPPMRNIRRKRRRQRSYPRSRRSKGSIILDSSNEEGNGEVKVAPRSEAGVLNVPGEKYGGKHGIKRTCDDEYEVHPHIRVRANTSKSNSSGNRAEAEYYFTTPHDVLGLEQEVSKDSENMNGSCIEVKKAAVRREDSFGTRPTAATKVSSPPTYSTMKPAGLQNPIQNQVPIQSTNQFYPQPQQLQQPQTMQQSQMMQQPQMVQQSISLQQRQSSQPTLEQSQAQMQFKMAVQNKSNNAAAVKDNVNFNAQKGQDFAKLVRYVDAPSRETETMSRQDLLKKDNDDVLENIDRVLKADRTGLFHEIPYASTPKKENTAGKDAPNQNNSPSDPNKVAVKRESTESDWKTNKIGKNKGEKRMNVDVTLNSQPISQFNPERGTEPKRRKINLHKKKTKSGFPSANKMSFSNMINKDSTIESFPKVDQQTDQAQQQMLSDPDLKIMENADDQNNDDLKQTLKEYINRQNEYNLGRQPEDEEEAVTPNYQLMQEKKNMLEDQTEPTSAAEQRELGRKDPFVTPSLLNEQESDNTLIVIPLKKDSGTSALAGRSGEFEQSKDGFKVKEAKDVIHVRTHPSTKTEGVYKKDIGRSGYDNSVFTKTVFNGIKDDFEGTSQEKRNDLDASPSKAKDITDDYQRGDYGVVKEREKLDPGKDSNSDYDDYENFDMKREISAANGNNFKSRHLKFVSYDDDSYKPKIRKKRNVENFDLDTNTVELDKRSEEDEPDEEPGNDSKEPVEHEKKVQKAPKSSEFSPKKEEGAMTFHMDAPGDVKRNDTENDFPPDDENDAGGGSAANTNKTATANVINYNFFNITVNMISSTTTTPACDVGSYGSDYPPGPQEFPASNDQQLGITNTENDQIERLAQDILQYTATTKDKLAPLEASESKDQDQDKDASKITSKDTDDSENESKDAKNAARLREMKQILSEDESEEKDVERSIDDKEEDEDEKKIQSHGVRSAVEDAKHREMLVSKLEHLVNSYKSHVQRDDSSENEEMENVDKRSNDNSDEGIDHKSLVLTDGDSQNGKGENVDKRSKDIGDDNEVSRESQTLRDDAPQIEEVESIDKRSNDNQDGMGVHHNQPKKKIPQPQQPGCDCDAPKHVLKSNRVQFIKPQEIYYEPESMADDLKEKLLFNKIYNRVVRKRKKAPDPFMYKIIDSVFGNDDEADLADMCPVNLDDESRQALDVTAKRTNQNEKNSDKSKVALFEPDDISRQKKRTEHMDEMMLEKDLEERRDRWNEPSNLIKKQIDDRSKIKFDNVDSFKDIIEVPNKGLRKREVGRRNLADVPPSYLSPMDENAGDEKRRKRRRLKFLHKPQKKKIRQVSYDDYVQTHGLGPKRFAERQSSGQTGNFNKGQNFKVKEQDKNKIVANNNTGMEPQALKAGGASTAMVNTTTAAPTEKGFEYKVSEKNCSTDLEELKGNHSKMIECELAKKEHEDMKRMLNGFLPLKIIDTFYERLKENPTLYNRFSGTIANSKQCASENAHNVRTFREEQAKVDIKHAEEMLHEVIVMLNQIVADQVHRRTCLQLAPNLKLFVIRITKNLRNMKKNYQVAEGYPLPKIKSRSEEELPQLPPEEDQGDFLFGSSGGEMKAGGPSNARSDINKKIKLIEKLLEKYQSMSSRCQVQVEPVKDYLLKHLGMLMKLSEKTQDSSTCATTTKNEEPLVREEEVAPPHGNITIPKAPAAMMEIPITSSTLKPIPNVNDRKFDGPGSEVSQRQQVMLRKQQEEEQKHQQLLQRQIQEQEMINQVQDDQLRQREIQEQQVGLPEQLQALPQQIRPFREDSEQSSLAESMQTSQNIPNIIGQNIQSREAQAQPNQQPQSKQQPQQALSNQPDQNNSPQPSASNPTNTSSTVAAIVQKELDPNGLKYTNPEMVTKNLLDLGLDQATTYLPPFDINQMVQENIIKADIEANAKGELIPHLSHSPPQPGAKQPPSKTGPKKRDVFEQELSYDKMDDVEDVTADNEKTGDKRQEYEKSVTSGNNGRIMSKNQELQDLLTTDLDSKSVFNNKRLIRQTKPAPQTANANQPQPQAPPPQMNQNAKENWDPSKIDFTNFGKKQFIWQPLLVKPTQIPDPDVEDTEYYSGQKYTDPQLVNKDLEQLGLDGEINSYVMPFTVNSVIQNQIQASAKNTEPKIPMLKPPTLQPKTRREMLKSHYNVSEKYKKLLDTYNNIREKRQNEERIGKLYGAKSPDGKMDDLKSVNKEMQDISKISFEKPIVFSLEG